jgi:hypothetical protein
MTTTGCPFFIEAADVAVGVVVGVDLVRVHRQCDEELMGARHPAVSLGRLAGCRAVVLGGTDGDGRG